LENGRGSAAAVFVSFVSRRHLAGNIEEGAERCRHMAMAGGGVADDIEKEAANKSCDRNLLNNLTKWSNLLQNEALLENVRHKPCIICIAALR
jgi:NADH:ubiquinone oxidoreductase subunit D